MLVSQLQEPPQGFSGKPPQGPPQDEEEQEPLQGPPQDDEEQEPPQGFSGKPPQGPPKRPPHGPNQGPHRGPFPRPHGPPPPVFNNFTTPQLNDIVNHILREGGRFRAKMSNKMNGPCMGDHLRHVFDNYNLTLEMVGEKYESCVTDEMKALPEKARAEILSCVPTHSDLQEEREIEKAHFEDLLQKLSAADIEISAMTDDVQKQMKITKVQWTNVMTYYNDLSDRKFSHIQTVNACVSNKRAEIKSLEMCIRDRVKTENSFQ